MCKPSQLNIAANGVGVVSSGNPNLDGTGPMSLIFTGAFDGTMLQTITLKTVSANAQGMIRLFIKSLSAGALFLWREVPIPANVQSDTTPAYQTTIRASFILKDGDELWVSTQNDETWNILAEGITWKNCPCEEV